MKNLSSEKDSSDYEEDRLSAPLGFDGPISTRKCTDALCVLLLLVMWGAMTVVGIYSWNNRDYRAVLYPVDYDGNICGTDFGAQDMTDYPKILYVNFAAGVCVKECPTFEELVDVHTLVIYGGIYQGADAFLPADYVNMADYSNATGLRTCTEDTCNNDPTINWFQSSILGGNSYAYYALDTFEVLGVRCISNPHASEKLQEEITTPEDNLYIGLDADEKERQMVMANLNGDIYEARYYVVPFGLVLAPLIGFIYSQLLRVQCIVGTVIWGSILLSIAMVFFSATCIFIRAEAWMAADPQVFPDSSITSAKVFSYILFCLGSVAVFVTLFLRRQIMLSLERVRAAGRAMSAMPSMMLFPILQVLGLAAFMVIWLVYAVHLASTGDVTTKQIPSNTAPVSYRSIEFDDFANQCGWYLLFCFFWSSAFISAMGEIVIAMSVSQWYFTRDKSRGVGSCTIFTSIKDAFRITLELLHLDLLSLQFSR